MRYLKGCPKNYPLLPTPNQYMQVDWNKMTNDSASMADRIKKKLHIKSKSSFERFQEWSEKNIYLAGGFTGGFFLGIASS